eukprot:Lithocolla_globosa_v1_NODE_3421_length_1675_cov_99.586420.p1 type:complete len:279 gc:universal NODE_3421_length_1675_cov_99.586420:424-1260(+)
MDELHLRLRITDRLLDVMIHHAIEMDIVDKKATKSSPLKGPAIHNLVKVINNDCKVSFRVWQKQDKGKEADYTSIMGPGKLLLMECIGDHLHKIFSPEFTSKYKKLWSGFDHLYAQIEKTSKGTPAPFVGAEKFREEVSHFLNDFLTLGAPGTTRTNITPYMHLLWEHVADDMENGGLRQFSGQGVEGLNDVHRRTYRSKSNKWDPEGDCLRLELRFHYLERKGRKKVKRSYKKTDQHGKGHTRAAKKQREENKVVDEPKKARGRPKRSNSNKTSLQK